MQNIFGRCQQTFENKKFVDITQLCFALLPQVNFSSIKVKVIGSNPVYLLKSVLYYLDMVWYIYLNFCVLIIFSRLRRHQNFASCRNIPICQYQHGIFDIDEESVEVSNGYGCIEHSKWPKKLGTFGRFVGQNPESTWR